MVSEQRLKELIQIKNKQRAISKAEYIKNITNPHRHGRGEGGTVFDAGLQRWTAMDFTRSHFFTPSAKQALRGMLIYVIPVGLTMYLIKSSRDEKEARFRSGMVSYRDREFKFI